RPFCNRTSTRRERAAAIAVIFLKRGADESGVRPQCARKRRRRNRAYLDSLVHSAIVHLREETKQRPS
ncbi:hypothetical protein PENTCL1PPCAC_10116, partial [Pristionchus entomophagus]